MTAAYVLAGELAEAGDRYDAAFKKYEQLLRPYDEIKQRGAERFAAACAKDSLGAVVSQSSGKGIRNTGFG